MFALVEVDRFAATESYVGVTLDPDGNDPLWAVPARLLAKAIRIG